MSGIQHNLFSSTSCNVCMLSRTKTTVTTVKLLKCLGCKLIVYCSGAHQKLDWPIHKKFCKAVSTLLAQYKVNHIFSIAGPIKSKEDLSEVTVKVKYKIVSLLNRPLEYHEEELTSFPVMCSVCFSTKFNNLYQCKVCNAVSYCCLEHEEVDAPVHRNECIHLKLHYCKFKLDSNLNFKVELKEKACRLVKSDLRKIMTTMFGIQFASDPSESLVEYQKISYVSDFSCIATVSYFIEYLKTYRDVGKAFTFYVAGATVDEIWFTQVHIEFLFHCFSEISKLNIVFIGPEIPHNGIKESIIELDNGRSVIQTSFQGTLENYLENNKIELKLIPDLITCFNCGFSENACGVGPSDSWLKGIQCLMKLPEIPILFTSYTSAEADSDLRALEYAIQDTRGNDNYIHLERIIEKQQNPYRDMRPLRNWQFNDPESIFFRNGYLQAVRFTSNLGKLEINN